VDFEIKGIAFGAVTSGGLIAVFLKVQDFWNVAGRVVQGQRVQGEL